MKRIALLFSLTLGASAYGQTNVPALKSCVTDWGCVYLTANLQTGRETMYVPQKVFLAISPEQKADFTRLGYRLSLITPGVDKSLEQRTTAVIPEKSLDEMLREVETANREHLKAGAICIFASAACGATFAPPISWVFVVPACGQAIVSCIDAADKLAIWREARARYWEKKQREVEEAEASAVEHAFEPPSGVVTDASGEGKGFGSGDGIFPSLDMSPLPEGHVEIFEPAPSWN